MRTCDASFCGNSVEQHLSNITSKKFAAEMVHTQQDAKAYTRCPQVILEKGTELGRAAGSCDVDLAMHRRSLIQACFRSNSPAEGHEESKVTVLQTVFLHKH